MYTIFLCLGPIVGGVAGGYTGFELGWAYNFWIATALSGACFLGVLIFVPETLYDRAHVHESARITEDSPKEGQATHTEKLATPPSVDYRPYTFTRSLGFRAPTGSLLRHFIQPWRTLALPGTWVVMLHYAGLVGGIVTISTVGAQLVQQPPYLWGANAGLINIGGIIGAVMGYMYTHVLSDRNLTRRARHDAHGLAEAEDRLPTMFLPLAVATCGFFVFGFCAEYPGGNRWVGLEVGYGMLAFGLMQVPSIGFNYVGLPVPPISSVALGLISLGPTVTGNRTDCGDPSSSTRTGTSRPTASSWSPSSAPSSPSPGPFSCPSGSRTAGRRSPLASSACSWASSRC